MTCPKCGKTIEAGAAFCTGCGERMEAVTKPEGTRVRKQYKTSVYIILDLFAYGLIFGVNDFYAGFYKMGLFRLISSLAGFVLGMATSSLALFFLPGISILIGFIELFGALGKAQMLENGQVVFIKPIDIIYDREGTDNYLKSQYGCGLRIKPRKEYSTEIYVLLYFLLGGGFFAVNDFYAGYIKVGIFRVSLILLIQISGIATSNSSLAFIPLVILGFAILVGVAELLLVSPRKYMLENGNLAKIRPLDVIYDRMGTEVMLRMKYGCGLQGRKRFDFGTK